MTTGSIGRLGAPRTTGARVRTVRTSCGVSLRELARRIGVSPATLSALETGRTTVTSERLGMIAQALGLQVEQIIYPDAGDRRGAGPLDLGAGQRVGVGSWRQYPPLDLGPILNSALDCFVRVGYHAASIREVADRAGLSVPGVYHHYPSKQQMLVRLMDLTMRDLLHRSRAAAAEGEDVVGRFSAVAESLVLFHTQRQDLAFVASSEMRSLEPEARRRLQEARNEEQRMLDVEVVAGRREGVFDVDHPIEASRAVGTMCTAVAGWFRPHGTLSPGEVARQHVRFSLNLVGFQGSPAEASVATRRRSGRAAG